MERVEDQDEVDEPRLEHFTESPTQPDVASVSGLSGTGLPDVLCDLEHEGDDPKPDPDQLTFGSGSRLQR